MPEKIIKALVDGGKASAAPPLGTSLAPLKLNIKEVIEKINEKTKEFPGISVPIEISTTPIINGGILIFSAMCAEHKTLFSLE